MRRKVRRQRVVLRSRQRVALHKRLQVAVIAAFLAGLVIVGGRMVTNETAPRILQRYSPILEVDAPNTLEGLALLSQPQQAPAWLWLPGAESQLRRKWLRHYPTVGKVSFDKRYGERRIIARLEPRIPLVQWQGQGLDENGAIFSLAADRWPDIPKANFSSPAAVPVVSRWIHELAKNTQIWNGVIGVSQDQRGEMWLWLRTGAHVAWGAPDIRSAQEKARGLSVVMEDARQRLGGVAAADLRFFNEGRVIVRPKSAT